MMGMEEVERMRICVFDHFREVQTVYQVALAQEGQVKEEKAKKQDDDRDPAEIQTSEWTTTQYGPLSKTRRKRTEQEGLGVELLTHELGRAPGSAPLARSRFLHHVLVGLVHERFKSSSRSRLLEPIIRHIEERHVAIFLSDSQHNS